MDQERAHFRSLPEHERLKALSGLEVNAGEFQTSQGPLFTLGAASCVVLVAHNERTRTGLIGHFSSIGLGAQHKLEDAKEFHRAVHALNDLGDRQDTKVILLGASQYDKEKLDTSADKEYALRALHEEDWSPQPDWLPEGQTIDVRLDSTKGLLQIITYQRDSLGGIIDAIHQANARNRED
jgi:hypothetical protein